MKTAELFKEKTVFSFEIFPPRKDTPVESIYSTLEALRDMTPDFISVTYSASGRANKDATLAIASRIKNEYHTESVAHLTCINHTQDEVRELLGELKANKIENILALLGDPVLGITPRQDFRHASDLVSFIKAHSDLNVLAACYPEGHPTAPSLEADIGHLKTKVDAGVDHLITQLFFDNSYFYDFRDKITATGIHVPVEVGIMPVINKAQAERVISMCGVQLPKKFRVMMDRFADNPEALRDAGLAYAVEQIIDLLANGVDGIHLYTMNSSLVAHRIDEAVRTLIKSGSWKS